MHVLFDNNTRSCVVTLCLQMLSQRVEYEQRMGPAGPAVEASAPAAGSKKKSKKDKPASAAQLIIDKVLQ